MTASPKDHHVARKASVFQVAFTKYMTEFVTCWGRLLVGFMLATLPVVILYFLLQHYYVQSVASTWTKW